LSYLQLNEYSKEKIFKEYIDDLFKNRQELEHPTALFYHGISKYEQREWEEAIIEFDKALKIYRIFLMQNITRICLARLESKKMYPFYTKKQRKMLKKGYTIEDNTVYETYPYQKKWTN
jgi:tetratricopeptide (TPR) repeat protein